MTKNVEPRPGPPDSTHTRPLFAGCSPRTVAPEAPDPRLSPVLAMSSTDVEGFEQALSPRDFVFPRDHGPHPGFKVEWWYRDLMFYQLRLRDGSGEPMSHGSLVAAVPLSGRGYVELVGYAGTGESRRSR